MFKLFTVLWATVALMCAFAIYVAFQQHNYISQHNCQPTGETHQYTTYITVPTGSSTILVPAEVTESKLLCDNQQVIWR